MDNYYCQKKCGEEDFSIEEWNKAYKYCQDASLSEAETSKVLNGEPCTEQCFDCIAIVGATRKKNQLLVEKMRAKT